MSMDTFVHLEVLSGFSFLWGTFSPEDLVEAAVSKGHRAVALTDYGLHGAVRFYKAAVKRGIQPIIGSKLPIWDGSHVIFLASDFKSYGNLCRLVSIVSDFGVLSRQDLSHYSKGLLTIAGLRDSRINRSLNNGRLSVAEFCLQELRSVLKDPEMVFLSVRNNGETDQPIENVISLAQTNNIEIVATNEVTFLTSQDYILHRILVDIQRKHHHRTVIPLPNDTFFFTSGYEMRSRIKNDRAIENTQYVASLCKGFSFPLGRLHPPYIKDPREASLNLSKRCFRELAMRRSNVGIEYFRRLDWELGSINGMGIADFFLLVRKIVDFARRNDIRHTVRGSAAGSLVVYLLLGGVDPIANDLLFERFINEGRGDMPDIDIDFDSEHRDEVIDYVLGLFPRQTAMVCTIHKLKCRSAVRLVARAMGYPLNEINRLASCLPWSLRGRDLKLSLEQLPELKGAPIQREKQLIDLASRLTGLPFQSSLHLGGVIIAPDDIKAWTAVGKSPKGVPVSQLDKDDVEALGLLKLDILGLRMHTAIRKALEILEEKRISLDFDRIPLDDKRTYSLLCSAHSVGVFQLESPGQRGLLGCLQPKEFKDLIAEVSLFRPGPVEGDMVKVYIERRNGEQPVPFWHESITKALEETYGVILFQEQVLRIAHFFAGLSYAEADAFRRAMTKDRKSRKMQLLKKSFIEGALAQGHDNDLAQEVFNHVSAFASYGFCKAHAASFAHITYQSAYLKAHYPQAFYLGILNAGQVGSYPHSVIVNEARRRGIQIYPPHVNFSGLRYKAEGSGIRTPLEEINGVGTAMARRIIANRKRFGLFKSKEE
ncbi:MAG: DNA polymerase III subunit alpha, partial [Syntrophaceae bacterium]|nr:DNA polymerase III subunit alpha [Syntrophaceae bacterium]